MHSRNNLAWLLIGMGIGLCLGERDTYILIFVIVMLIVGFLINYYNEKEEWKQIILENEKPIKKK